MQALVIACYGRQVLTAPLGPDQQPDFSQPVLAVTRGRRQDVLVGDLCEMSPTSPGQGVIESIAPRRNQVRRADSYKTKSLAANVDLVAIVVSGSPPCSEDLLFRMLTAARAEGLASVIIVNKCDLADSRQFAATRLAWAATLDQAVVKVSVRHDPEAARAALAPVLGGRRVLLMGESGMGKSSLLNLLVPDAAAQTQEISRVLNAGKHTTTFARLYPAHPAGMAALQVIDTPGFQLFGLSYLSITELMHAVPEIQSRLGQCRFSNCLHLSEPACVVREAAKQGQMDALRYRLYKDVVPETRR